MTDLEWPIRETARELARLYRELDAAKYAQTRQPEVRTMRPAPGPRPPAPDHLVSPDEELSSRLMEMVRECANHIQPTIILTKNGMRLCSFLAFNAHAVSGLSVAPDLLVELRDQVRALKRKLRPEASTTAVREAIRHAPKRYTAADAATLASAATGRDVTRKQVTYWGRSKDEVSTQINDEGVTTYELSEVVEVARSYKDARARDAPGM